MLFEKNSDFIVCYPGPINLGLKINVVGGQVLNVTGDRVIVKTDVGIKLGNFHYDQDFGFGK